MKRAAVLLVMGFTALWAQSDDGPGRGVARISLLSGDVSVKRGDSGELTAAAINAPLVVEDRVYTGSGSRTELQFDWSNMIRLASDSEVRLAELESERYQIQIARGTVTFRVLRDSNAEVELSTPSISVRPLKQGEYRISVLDDGTSEITVRGGEADVYTPKGAERLRSGKTMLARGTAADPEFQLVRAIPEDDWDKWNERRDRDLTRSRSYDYVSRDIYGAEDLDAHGTWMNVAPYGNVWSPNVAVGWAPYRAGRWVWVDWYGWTWVSYDPWGWAPYHYGRWFYAGSRWCWYPGPRYGRSSWSPALVAFFGFGHGGVGVGFGNVGWVPLAPHETYHPWYGGRYYAGYRNGGYNSNNVTIVNNTNITNIYRNSRVTNGIMAVNASNFGRGRGGDYVRVAGNDLERANLVRGQMPLAPGRESLRMSDREIRSGAFTRSSNENQRFFSRREPSRVDRVPFEQQRRGVEQVARQTWRTDENGGGSQRSAAAAERGTGFARTVDANERTSGQRTAQDSGWRRVGDPSRGEAAAGSRAAESVRSQDAGGGWRRFGDPATRGESAVRGGGRRDTGAAGVESTEGNSRGAQRDSGDSWRRFGSPGAESQGGAQRNTEGVTRQENGWRRQSGANDGATRQNEAGRPERSNRFEGGGRTERFSSAPESRSESIRISPPIVRERQPDSGGSGRATSRGDMGGGMRSAPRGETGGGRMSGGGGGFSRGESGGGGGARSGGGGGGRSEGRSGGRGR